MKVRQVVPVLFPIIVVGQQDLPVRLRPAPFPALPVQIREACVEKGYTVWKLICLDTALHSIVSVSLLENKPLTLLTVTFSRSTFW